MGSVIKFLNAQSIAPIEIRRQLYQIYGHTRLESQHMSCGSSAGRCLIIRPRALTSRPVIFIFSYTSRNSCSDSVSMTERRRWVSQWFQFQAPDVNGIGYKSWSHGMTNVLIPEVNMLKNSSTHAVSLPINIFIELGFVSVSQGNLLCESAT